MSANRPSSLSRAERRGEQEIRIREGEELSMKVCHSYYYPETAESNSCYGNKHELRSVESERERYRWDGDGSGVHRNVCANSVGEGRGGKEQRRGEELGGGKERGWMEEEARQEDSAPVAPSLLSSLLLLQPHLRLSAVGRKVIRIAFFLLRSPQAKRASPFLASSRPASTS